MQLGKLVINLHKMGYAFSEMAQEHLLHSFKRSFNGFVVKLTQEEVHKMAREFEQFNLIFCFTFLYLKYY